MEKDENESGDGGAGKVKERWRIWTLPECKSSSRGEEQFLLTWSGAGQHAMRRSRSGMHRGQASTFMYADRKVVARG